MISTETTTWPDKYRVLGVLVSNTTYDQAVDVILLAAAVREPAVVSFHPVHAIVTASRDLTLRAAVNDFEIVAPDGQPVRWALNWLHGMRLKDRVYGPELMLRVCRRAAKAGIPIFLYGSSQAVIDALCQRLTERYPELRIAGAESPPFRPLSQEEDDAIVQRINSSEAGIMFVGLGAPKQDLFAHKHRGRIQAVQVCVGAAFDFHAGTLRMAPPWMQRTGLEWLFRLWQEPGRLWKRYLFTNTVFLWDLASELTRRRFDALTKRLRRNHENRQH